MSRKGSIEGNDRLESHEALLAAEENSERSEKSIRGHQSQSFSKRGIAISSLIFLLGGVLGFCAGLLSTHLSSGTSTLSDAVPQVPIGKTVQVFDSRSEFMGPPPSDNSTEPAWDSLLPRGLGYVSSPDATQNISVIGAFHQLHCLYTVRRIYYATLAKTQEEHEMGHGLAPFDNGIERPEHAAHCFEYLRQALMCNADSSLEPFEATQERYPGMGFQRQCKDYMSLREYAEDYRLMDAQSFIYEGPEI